MKGIIYQDDLGTLSQEEDIPSDLLAEAKAWRDKMLEALAEIDGSIMEKYLER